MVLMMLMVLMMHVPVAPPLMVCLCPAVIGQVVTPTRVGQSYTYSPGQHSQQDLYDVPPSRAQQGVRARSWAGRGLPVTCFV